MFFSTQKESLYNFEPQEKPSHTTRETQPYHKTNAGMMTQQNLLDNTLEISTGNRGQ